MTQTLDLHDPASRKTLTSLSLAVAKARRVVIVTGAGISCSCGIPDFRSTDGLYNLVKSRYPTAVVKGRDLFDSSLFRDAQSTSIFYTFISSLKLAIDRAEPSPTHRFISQLDTKGKLLRSYTQNIDGLEERVGVVSSSSESVQKGKGKDKIKVNDVKNVLLHGDIHRVRCTLCSASFTCNPSHIASFQQGIPPECSECLERSEARVARSARALAIGTLRPAIVLYDEPHPLGDDIGTIQTKDLSRKPDLLIVMGTSLKVHGLKKLVKEFASTIHQSQSQSSSQTAKGTLSKAFMNKVIFVNKTPPSSSEWDGIIDYHVQGLTDAWVEKVLEDWKKMRPQDWEVQQTLEEASSARVVKDLTAVKAKKPTKKAGKKVDTENVAPSQISPPSSQSSTDTLVDSNEKENDFFILMPPKPSTSKPHRTAKGRGKSVSAPQLAFSGRPVPRTAPIPLSPSKRQNRTHTSQQPGRYTRATSSSSTLLGDEYETEVAMAQSDAEPPHYDSESERGSPRKKTRTRTRTTGKRAPCDMSIDEISFAGKEGRGLLFPAGPDASTMDMSFELEA